MIGGFIGHSNHEEIKFKISADRRKTASKTSTLDMKWAKFRPFWELVSEVPWENASFCPAKAAKAVAVLSFLWEAGASPWPWTSQSVCAAADDGLSTGGKGQNQFSVPALLCGSNLWRCTQHWRLSLDLSAGLPKKDDSALTWEGEHPGPELPVRMMTCPGETKVTNTFPSRKLLCGRKPWMYSAADVGSRSLLWAADTARQYWNTANSAPSRRASGGAAVGVSREGRAGGGRARRGGAPLPRCRCGGRRRRDARPAPAVSRRSRQLTPPFPGCRPPCCGSCSRWPPWPRSSVRRWVPASPPPPPGPPGGSGGRLWGARGPPWPREGWQGPPAAAWRKALRLGPFLHHERFRAHERRTGRGCRACDCADGEIPELGQGGVRALLPSRPAAPGPPEVWKGRRCRPAGAVLPAPGLPARPGIAEASLSNPGPWGNGTDTAGRSRGKTCSSWAVWEEGKRFFLFCIDSVVAALSRGTQYHSLRTNPHAPQVLWFMPRVEGRVILLPWWML